jgi:dihydrofolate reductase
VIAYLHRLPSDTDQRALGPQLLVMPVGRISDCGVSLVISCSISVANGYKLQNAHLRFQPSTGSDTRGLHRPYGCARPSKRAPRNEGAPVTKLRFNIAISLDGYVAGPSQSEENPIGVGGMQLHEWMFPLAAFRETHGKPGGEVNANTEVVEERFENIGATIMGRNMFGPVRGPWGENPWRGWWGEDPPFHNPVFVLTHHPREPLEMRGGTTFHFVTGGAEAALEEARETAGDGDISLAGGASVARQYLNARLLDEVELSIVPLLLGSGERLFDGVEGLELEQLRAVKAPGVTHLKYRVLR